jgi:hypothetical protein
MHARTACRRLGVPHIPVLGVQQDASHALSHSLRQVTGHFSVEQLQHCACEEALFCIGVRVGTYKVSDVGIGALLKQNIHRLQRIQLDGV